MLIIWECNILSRTADLNTLDYESHTDKTHVWQCWVQARNPVADILLVLKKDLLWINMFIFIIITEYTIHTVLDQENNTSQV